MSTASFQYYG